MVDNLKNLKENQIKSEREKLRNLSYIYGSSLPFNLLMERSIFSTQCRLPGLPTSYLGLEIATGNDVTLPFPAFIEEVPSIEIPLSRLDINRH